MENALGLLGFSRDVSTIDVVSLLEKGFTKRNYLNAKQFIGFSHDEMATILSVSTRTLETKGNNDRLNDSASERLLKLAEVLVLGTQTFNNLDLFRGWLERPLRPLGGKSPKEIMVNMYGLDTVKNLLGRISHGVYS